MPVDYKNGWIFALFFNQPCPIKTKTVSEDHWKTKKKAIAKKIWYKEKNSPDTTIYNVGALHIFRI